MTNAWLTERYLRAPDGTFPHLGVRGGGDVAAVALLSGSPARVDQMEGCLDETRKVGDARGYLVCTGTSDGRPVTVATSGVGSPSMAIAVEELAACGARTFIRVGSCASITERLPVGGIMVATAAVCDEGTSRYYAPANFPPVASLTVVNALVDAASALEVPVALGMTRSTDSFYQGERRASIVERWRQLGVLTFEMETSCLFTRRRHPRPGSRFDRLRRFQPAHRRRHLPRPRARRLRRRTAIDASRRHCRSVLVGRSNVTAVGAGQAGVRAESYSDSSACQCRVAAASSYVGLSGTAKPCRAG
jgi:uridine phosphorylase